MALSGSAQLVAHIGEEGGLGGVRGLGLEALAQRLVARFLQLARQVFDLEAQAGVLVDPLGEAAAVEEELRRIGRDDNRGAVVQQRVAEREAQRRHRRDRRQAGEKHVHMRGAADDEAREHGDGRAGQEDVVDLAGGIPQQPGHQAPYRADDHLQHGHAREPRAHGFIVGLAGGGHLVEGDDVRGQEHRDRHDAGQQDRLLERAMAEIAETVGAEPGERQGPIAAR